MPYDENHLLYITTDVGSNSLDLIDKIRSLWLNRSKIPQIIFLVDSEKMLFISRYL
jgi:hypothetical protein